MHYANVTLCLHSPPAATAMWHLIITKVQEIPEMHKIPGKILQQVRQSLMSNQNVAGHVTHCPLICHGEYANRTERQTDGRQTIT